MIATKSLDSGHHNACHGKMRTVLMSLKTAGVLFALFILIYSANFYFLSRLSVDTSSSIKPKVDYSSVIDFSGSLDESSIKQVYKIRNPKFDQISKKILKNFAPCTIDKKNFSAIWSIADKASFTKDNIEQVAKSCLF